MRITKMQTSINLFLLSSIECLLSSHVMFSDIYHVNMCLLVL